MYQKLKRTIVLFRPVRTKRITELRSIPFYPILSRLRIKWYLSATGLIDHVFWRKNGHRTIDVSKIPMKYKATNLF